jgi:Family of unknown function (DUF5681)
MWSLVILTKALMRSVTMNKRKLGGERRREQQDYEVGHGRPSKSTQFQPGHSGPKRRRRKRSTTVAMDVKKGLNRKVSVRNGDGGEPIKMSEREFAVSSLVQRAMKGDMAAIKLVLGLDRQAELADRAAAPEFQEWPPEPIEFVWTEEQEKLHQELRDNIKSFEDAQNAGEQE